VPTTTRDSSCFYCILVETHRVCTKLHYSLLTWLLVDRSCELAGAVGKEAA
jgi:hypothetical protein